MHYMKQKFQAFGQWLITLFRPYYAKFNQRWEAFAKRKPRLARWTKRIGFTFLAFLFLFQLFIFAISLTTPSKRELSQLQTKAASDLYSADGVLLGRYYTQYRIMVPYDSIPAEVLQALVATEDERYFQHNGIDYRSWGRVLYRTIIKGDRSGGGGSTISQQLAKNLLTRSDYLLFSLLINKVREIITARRLEKAYNKEELLALYLNTVPFPDNMFGIDVAAQRFFSKPASQLNLEEGAVLIGTLRGTTYYNPMRYPERATLRRNVVIQQMEKNDYLSQQTGDSLQALPLELHYDPEFKNEGIAPYFREFVRREVDRVLEGKTKENGEPYDLYNDGLKVYTTLHAGLQRQAEESVRKHLTEVQHTFDKHWDGFTAPWHDVTTIEFAMKNSLLYQHLKAEQLSEEAIQQKFEEKDTVTIFTWDGPKDVVMSPLDVIKHHLGLLQVGFMAMEPNTGFIRAWVGGVDYDFFQYDHVRSRRQSGSVFKPVVYTQALRSGIDPCEQFQNKLLVYHEYAKGDWWIKDPRKDDPEPHFKPDGTDLDDWIPQNADGKYGGSYSMMGALTNSVNVVTVDLIMRTGVQPVIDLARAMGITGDIPPEPSIALGAAEMSLYELIQPFAILANNGQKVAPTAINRIETSDGTILVDFRQQDSVQIVVPDRARIVTHMLESVATMGTASRLRWKYGLYNQPIAGKTGTSQNHADGWFIGYTPKLVAGVWVGGDSPLVRFRNFENGQGANTALPIWAYFMKEVLKKPEFEAWQGGSFPKLTPEESRQLACPMRIKSPEEIFQDSILQDSLQRMELLDSLRTEFVRDSLEQGGEG
ncbi:MAG: penicillin-binding protein 1A [Saprospiraceae bacterium]|nr:MAG: penicillin-binding protein 1A [Saprospiraceae bacterium]